MEFANLYERDYMRYKNFVKERSFLFEHDEFSNIEKIYKKLYTISELLSFLEDIDSKSMIGDFSKELKNTLVISFDLLNMNYLNSSKQIFRSAIENFFRLSLSISRYLEYRDNISKGFFKSNDSLKNLNSLFMGQSVYRLTSGTLDYFENTRIITCLTTLNTYYTELSGNVHVNNPLNFSPQKYLEDYSKYNNESIICFISCYLNVINSISVVLVFLLGKLDKKITKTQIQIIELGMSSDLKIVMDNIF